MTHTESGLPLNEHSVSPTGYRPRTQPRLSRPLLLLQKSELFGFETDNCGILTSALLYYL